MAMDQTLPVDGRGADDSYGDDNSEEVTARMAAQTAPYRPSGEMRRQHWNLTTDINATLEPNAQRLSRTNAEAVEALQVVAIGEDGDFEPLNVLGEGGMGVVHAANQRALGRVVAIKTTRSDAEIEVMALLQEAWATGQLEHPSIIPVHSLNRDSEGRPQLVMKRVEGRAWSELLLNPELLPEEHREDAERYHLELLVQVCNAVAFAHSRKILHRDLKPDNVMVGPFGEVYLLDWGIAVALPGGDPRLPSRDDIQSVVGTGYFMAPEMVEASARDIDERTDVYQLGAILYLLLTGRPRHAGRSLMEVLINARESAPPVWIEDVPSDLRFICERATAANRTQRYASVPAFQGALRAHLAHRHSLRLTHQATAKLAQLELVTSVEQQSHLEPSIERTAEIAALYSSCRFGFQMASRYQANEVARQGDQQAIEMMLGYRLELQDLKSAELLWAELDAPSEAVTNSLQTLRDAEAGGRQNQLNAEARMNMDSSYGTRTGRLWAC